MSEMRFSTRLFMAMMVCFGVLGANTSFAQEKSLDEQLFEELESIPNLPSPTEEDASKPAPLSDVDQQLQRELGGEDLGQARDSNPLRMLAETMQQVQRRLRAKDLATETQQIQGRIVGDLDKIIEQLQQQQQQPQGGGQQQKQQQKQKQQRSKSQQQKSQQKQGNKPGGKPSSKPANDSTTQLGSVEAAETSSATRDQMMQDAWGNLPASTQQEMRSARPEKFLPKYSRLIEEYFRRLAEEQKK